ncbi:hypothetical protein IWQ56_002997 [Coemansia nantahalensis]|nr:hypothetical protein IWQ56_002997 [Coemansia nantahalensis]
MHSLPPPTPKTPVLLVRLPRHVADSLQTVAADQLRLALGGKERVTTGTLFVGATQHDVRYSGERSSAPPLVFQGRATRPTRDGGWAPWTQRGKVVGKLTIVQRGKAPSVAATEARHRAPAAPVAAAAKPPVTSAKTPGGAIAAKTVPQKKPGIFRQNREILRDRILHMLACGPMDEAKIIDEIGSPQGVVLEVLGALATKSGAMWSLLPGRFRLVQIESWPRYDLQTRVRVSDNALRAFDTLGLPADDPDRGRRAVHRAESRRTLHTLPGLRSGIPESETDAAVSRVQERLVQLGERRISGPAVNGRSRSSSDVQRGAPRRARGPSLSPITDQQPSPSPPPSPPPQIEQAETVEELQELQQQLVSSYAEYSQLRLRIESRCAAFAPLAEELAAAQAACAATLQARQPGDFDREEGEEVPGDQRGGSGELSARATTSKLAADGSRLYWRDAGGTSWLADSPDAVVGQSVGRDGQPCRTQQLLPEEARVLRATQAIASQYAEMGYDDTRRWVRRYLRLHTHIERMDRELSAAYRRIAAGLDVQLDALRADLGDAAVDAALARPGDEPEPRVLTLDMYQDDDAADATTAP